MATSTIRIDDRLEDESQDLPARTSPGKSVLVHEAARPRAAIAQLERLRDQVAPFAEAHGWSTDEDVFREVS